MSHGMLPTRLLGAAASAFYGGWSTAAVLHTPSPAVLVDMSGAYSWGFGTEGLQALRIASNVTTRKVTEELWDFGPIDRNDLLGEGHPFAGRMILVRLRPHGTMLPVKPVRRGEARLVIAPVDLDGGTAWWWFTDVLAGVALGGTWPTRGDVVEAVEFVPGESQEHLRPVRLPTGRMVDLIREDLALATREERRLVRGDASRPEWERTQLDGQLRMVGSTWCFGNLARIDRERITKPVIEEVVGPLGGLLRIKTRHPEHPGPQFDLMLAGAVTSRVRLAMAQTIAHLEHRGGSWLHAATDSLLIAATHATEPEFVPCPGGPTKEGRRRGFMALPITTIRAVLANSGAPWKEERGFDRPLDGYVSGVYRFAFVDPAGEESFATEAALGGTYRDPTASGARTEDGSHCWAVEGHLAVARAGIHWRGTGPLPEMELPAWAEHPVARLGMADTWEQVERLQRAFPERPIRPGTRYLQAVIDPRRSEHVVAVTLDTDPPAGDLFRAEWRDTTGMPVTISTETPPLLGSIRAMTYRELLESWRLPRDTTSEPIERTDSILEPGFRRTLPVFSRESLFELVGKEGDDLLALMIDPGAEKGTDLTVYQAADTWTPVRQAAQVFGIDRLVTAGLNRRTARRILNGAKTSPTTAALVAEFVGGGKSEPVSRVCALPGCGKPVRTRQRYHADRCRKAAARAKDRMALRAIGASRCRHCQAVRFGDASGPCPGCGNRAPAVAAVVVCPTCGVELFGNTSGACPACGAVE